ncbi:MAG: hypothetical protein ACFBSE_08510 [Prochloraceae cyanobacterium]
MENTETKKGYKIGTTAIIWGFATAILGICIPLTAITQSGAILPLSVIIGASGATLAVWRNYSRSHLHKIEQLQNRCVQLETRIIDLETICSRQELSETEKFKQLESDRIKT